MFKFTPLTYNDFIGNSNIGVTVVQLMLTAEEIDLLPNEDNIDFYRQHGYYISKKILPDYLLDAAIAGCERFYAGDFDRPLPDGADKGWRPEDGNGVLRKNDYPSFQLDAFEAIVKYPLLGAVAAKLFGEPVRLWTDQLLYKPQDDAKATANIGWHTDRQYWKCCTSKDMFTAWIPFRDCNVKEGTLTVIDASHRWPDNTDGLDFRAQDFNVLEERFNTGNYPVVKVPIELQRGQVSFHHCMTLHGSGPNSSDLPRIALSVHMQGESNRWREYEYLMPDGSIKKHDVEILARKRNGVPDFTDPAICPYLWPIENN